MVWDCCGLDLRDTAPMCGKRFEHRCDRVTALTGLGTSESDTESATEPTGACLHPSLDRRANEEGDGEKTP